MTDLLPRRLNRKLTDFGSPAAVYVDRLYILISEANNDGWAGDLLREVRNEKPADPALVAFAMKLQPAPNLDGYVTGNSTYWNPASFDLFMRWVCRINCGEKGGTGILIGPDLVVTNSHVVQSIKDKDGKLHGAVCIFDHRKLGQTEEPGRAVAVDTTWVVPERPWNLEEGFPGQKEPDQSELDYAILRLTVKVGNEPLGDPAKALLAPMPFGYSRRVKTKRASPDLGGTCFFGGAASRSPVVGRPAGNCAAGGAGGWRFAGCS